MNRKFVCWALATMLVCAMPVAYAAPSKTTGDMTTITDYHTPLAGTIISILPMSSEAMEVLQAISDASSLSEYFGEAVWARVVALAGTDSLDLVELTPLSMTGYHPILGDTARVFTFPTVLSGKVVGVVCVGSSWSPVRVEAVNGSAEVYFQQALLTAMNDQNALLAILVGK